MLKEISHISDPIVLHIWASLHNYDYNNALFAAERLYSETKCDESLFLLATCFYRSGRPKQASCLLQTKGAFSAKCRYLLAKCCWDTGLSAEAESAIVGPLLASKSVDEIAVEFGDIACYVLLLLGDIYRYTDRVKKAVECYRKCLQLNPLMWAAFEYLCNIGEEIDPNTVFQYPEGKQISTPTLIVTTHTIATVSQQQFHRSQLATQQLQQEQQQDTEMCSENLNPHEIDCATPMDATTTTNQSHTVDQTNDGNKTMEIETPGFSHPRSVISYMDVKSTPVTGNFHPPLTAPKPSKTLRKTGRNLFCPSSLLSHTATPTFGMLSMDIQSPLFASVPVFTPTPHYPPTSTQENLSHTVGSTTLDSVGGVSRRLRGRRTLAGGGSGGSGSVNVTANITSGGQAPYRRGTSTPAAPGVLQSGGTNRPDPPVLRSSHRGSPGVGGSGGSSGDGPTSPTASSVSPVGMAPAPRLLGAKENTSGGPAGSVAGTGPRTRAQAARAAAQRKTRGRDATKKEDDEKDSNITGIGSSTSGVPQSGSGVVCDPRRQSLEVYLTLLCELGGIYASLAGFQCPEALSRLDALSPSQYNTGLSLSWAAKAHMEMADYTAASRLLSEVRQLEPWQLRGMEAYSTALWHQQKDMSLSALAADLLELDRNAPEPWCAAGNCFSLQREHEVAIRYFQRALQVSPRFTYAYTLLGHEYTAVEELDKALTAYRHATGYEHRHYNAWFGQANVYFKQEKFTLAEVHLTKAVSIYPDSPILLTNLGVVRARLDRMEGPGGALDCLDKAARLGRSPLAKYHRAAVLILLERYQEALEELEELRQMAPKESMVYFTLGRVHKKLGNTPQAMIYFSWAMDLDPKGANSQLKDILNNRNPVDDALLDMNDLSDSMGTVGGPETSGTAGDGSAFESL